MVQSLGKIAVASAGTPGQVTTATTYCNSILMETWPTNTGKMYIGTSASMNKSTGDGLVAILPAPTNGVLFSWSATVPYAPGGVRGDQLWIDADNSGDSLLVSIAVA